jgi:hypothetical protein
MPAKSVTVEALAEVVRGYAPREEPGPPFLVTEFLGFTARKDGRCRTLVGCREYGDRVGIGEAEALIWCGRFNAYAEMLGDGAPDARCTTDEAFAQDALSLGLHSTDPKASESMYARWMDGYTHEKRCIEAIQDQQQADEQAHFDGVDVER